MARWYQNVLTGQQVEVKTLDEDDFYVDNKANWCRIAAPSKPAPAEAPAPTNAQAKKRA
jgi:hypothetical protein